jgi:predicted DCC family thiol-disulfide oxidoreductase YuxK
MGSPDPVEVPSPVLVLFDGVCNLCNGIVRFIIKRDPRGKFRFASIQSDVGQSQLRQFTLDPDSLHSVVVIDDGKVFERSDAALRIARELGIPWKWFTALKILPRFLRDACYDLIASHRYRIFGRREHCMVAPPEWKDRFLDQDL